MAEDGRLASISSNAGFMREFGEATSDRLFLFSSPSDDPESATEVTAPRTVAASAEVLRGIEDTALRYGGHAALRRAGLTVTDWTLFYRANIEVESGSVAQIA